MILHDRRDKMIEIAFTDLEIGDVFCEDLDTAISIKTSDNTSIVHEDGQWLLQVHSNLSSTLTVFKIEGQLIVDWSYDE